MSICLLEWGYLDHDWAGTGLAAGHCNQGRPQWSLSRVWRVSSSRVEKPELASSRTAPARSAHAHRLACLDASPSAARCRFEKGTPLQVELVVHRGRTHKRTDPFPSTTIFCYLWQRAEPKAAGTAHPGLHFLRSRGGRAPKGGQAESVSSTIFFVLGRFFLWSGWHYATG